MGDDIVAKALWSAPLMVAAPTWHPLLKHKRISLDEVLRYPLVLVTHMHMGVMNVRSNECCRG